MKNCFLLLLFLISGIIHAQSQKAISTEAIAELAIERGLKEIDLGIYGGTLFKQLCEELSKSLKLLESCAKNSQNTEGVSSLRSREI